MIAHEPTGCSKRPSSAAAASEEQRLTLVVRRVSERCENKAGGLFQHPAKAGQPIAGILTFDHRKRLVYKYTGSNSRFNNLVATSMWFWRAISEAKEAGAEELDLARSPLDNQGRPVYRHIG
jgi:lipid II:glycine glycyltransferase (peptidoglycan interpeptide bridge formation enzyme)